MSSQASRQMSSDLEQAIQNCTECHRVCLATAQHCLQLGGGHAEASLIRLLLDCAEICQTSADFMISGSEFQARICGVCAEICDRCAAECERLADGDQMMMRCAEVCRRCAESCRQMAAAA